MVPFICNVHDRQSHRDRKVSHCQRLEGGEEVLVDMGFLFGVINMC